MFISVPDIVFGEKTGYFRRIFLPGAEPGIFRGRGGFLE